MRTHMVVNTRGRSACRRVAVVALVAGLAPAAWGCGEAVREGTGSAFVVIDSLAASPGGASSSSFSNTLQSDVRTGGSVFEDNGRVVMHLAPKDIRTPLTSNNTVNITRYRVEFRRSDGRNTPGVDVPYPFDGASSFSVSEDQTTGGFVLVRAQAKLEGPLIQLAGGGGAIAISTTAEVTFYGKDQTGHDVSISASMSVNFADWADPQGTDNGSGS